MVRFCVQEMRRNSIFLNISSCWFMEHVMCTLSNRFLEPNHVGTNRCQMHNIVHRWDHCFKWRKNISNIFSTGLSVCICVWAMFYYDILFHARKISNHPKPIVFFLHLLFFLCDFSMSPPTSSAASRNKWKNKNRMNGMAEKQYYPFIFQPLKYPCLVLSIIRISISVRQFVGCALGAWIVYMYRIFILVIFN